MKTLNTPCRFHSGFTLAELLIVLAVMGLIAALTVPTLIQSSRTKKSLSVTQSALMEIQAAYSRYMMDYELSPNINFGTFASYLASQAKTYTGTINADASSSSLTCGSGSVVCAKLASGAVVAYQSNLDFAISSATTMTNRCIPLRIDPDGLLGTGTTSYSLYFVLQYDGRLQTIPELSATCNSYNTVGAADVGVTANSVAIPSWFSWQG